MTENIKRWHIYFDGRVQGVGFRFTSKLFAGELGLTGWVRNTWDDRVEMEVQGEADALTSLINKLKNKPPIIITNCDIRELPVKEGEKKFSVIATL